MLASNVYTFRLRYAFKGDEAELMAKFTQFLNQLAVQVDARFPFLPVQLDFVNWGNSRKGEEPYTFYYTFKIGEGEQFIVWDKRFESGDSPYVSKEGKNTFSATVRGLPTGNFLFLDIDAFEASLSTRTPKDLWPLLKKAAEDFESSSL